MDRKRLLDNWKQDEEIVIEYCTINLKSGCSGLKYHLITLDEGHWMKVFPYNH